MSSIFTILGGLGLFLFGMRVMSDGLQKMAGNSLRSILANHRLWISSRPHWRTAR